MKNKLFGYVMTGALSLGVIGGSAHAFAATENNTDATPAVEQAVNVKASLDEATKEKVQAIMDDLKSNLATIGVELPTKGGHGPRGDFLADLDDATKEKAQAILDQEKDGSITREEAQTQLAALGVELPIKGEHGHRGDFLAVLDDATKEKAQTILDQQKDGTITREEAQTQLAELGVELPTKGAANDFLAGLDANTKEVAQDLIDNAEAQLAELGVDHLPLKGFKGSKTE
ncbi:hypothetical protein EK386_09635 [Lysinibacillus antri]|uniref:EF-hand domain-containing protein n=1 Tax=Lysinibacillus antri TaxID=2498145 RepID=A0A3S0PPX4_9BACI|nr:hypothetical protein EK386_09635 [Lysinibacillus antri]